MVRCHIGTISSQLASLPAANYHRNASQLLTFTYQNKMLHPSGTDNNRNDKNYTTHTQLLPSFLMTICHLNSRNLTDFAAPSGIRQTTMLKIKMTREILMSKSTQHHRVQLPRLASHHFYSLNEHACQIPLKVQVTKTIQMPCFFGALVKQGTFHYQHEWERCHFCLSTAAKLGEKSCMLHMPSISIIWNKTVTGTQSQLTAYPLKSFNYEATVEYIFKPSLSAECNCC